ncbi:chromatin assembly factor 1, p105 subunit [Brevipalpus obovatus]|uniref:chromatin assembly factor 1, p105 subunit n=1 Tax=Brevipalpus obovatus TaxID=246614 RepID=UPI003D9E0FFB
MKIYTPEIAFHNLQPVLSCDIRKVDDSVYKLITSGSDRHVVIWKITLSRDPNAKRPIFVEPLADLNRHQKAINVARFSPDPKIFASGDDEGNIILWKLDDGENSSDQKMVANGFEDGDDFVNKESWVQWKVLRGHSDDVVDLCWSPSGQFLLSGSVDNMVYVWDTLSQKHTKINCHKGYIHGVAWDPLDDFLVSLSTDRVMRVFNARPPHKLVSKTSKASVKIEGGSEKITRLFYDDTLQTYSRRVCFTPGGELILTPSGIIEMEDEEKNFKFINASHVFSRSCFNKPTCYLPTGKMNTIAIKCCPQLYQLRENIESRFPFPYRIIFAVATNESILFYDTQQPLPFAMVSGIHYTRHTDISWSGDGRILTVCSTDGYCTFIMFQDGELGIPYDGPYYSYDPPKPVEMTPPKEPQQNSLNVSLNENQKKTPDLPKITKFFQKLEKSEKISPDPPKLCIRSVKRKQIVGVGITLESPSKKLKDSTPMDVSCPVLTINDDVNMSNS